MLVWFKHIRVDVTTPNIKVARNCVNVVKQHSIQERELPETRVPAK